MRRLARWLPRVLAGIRTAWLLVGATLLLIAALELALRAGFWLKDMGRPQIPPDPRVLASIPGSESWLPLHYRELEQLSDRWQPYVYFRQRAFTGQTIRIEPRGTRATWEPDSSHEAKADRPLRLLMLGGSSLWGFGARDDRTIPSLVARKLHDLGIHAKVENFSEIGYVSTQEAITLMRLLQIGHPPDVVLFFDGVNDTTSAMIEGMATVTTNEGNRVREFNLLQSTGRLTGALLGNLATSSALYRVAIGIRTRLGIAGPVRPVPSQYRLDQLVEGVVGGYEANVAMIEALGREYGFRPLLVWQPVVFSKRTLVPFEAEEAAKFHWVRPLFEEVHRRLRESPALKGDAAFLDLSGRLDGLESLAYLDYCHVTEEANELLATSIVERMIELGMDKSRAAGTGR
ncbi:hypothetical protein OJF2_59230 [Aquisphaera giovannonii]|uniref:SGNH hydrolase-type esterase domain-containing protein n=1 Tax=Aquisphaera giovannonii TaxID=406548 RepID=A0A5B9W9V3_9BACT|nr:SGNH/GDSL hydrolase family protein [Aquisphaera giovannonii]QEH37333.1 hypothetical protein OJF2_59230 [Aquisphaera giovannonii]